MSGSACLLSEGWTASYAPGNMTDSALIGGRLNQPAFSMGPINLTNQCSGGGDNIAPGAPTQIQIGKLTVYH
jgi:hypothetical protein